MAEVKGVASILRRALPTGVDAGRIAQWELRKGYTFGQWVATASQAIAGWNQAMIAKWGDIIHITEDIMMEYPNGGSVTPAALLPDTDRPEPKHGTTVGHHLPLAVYADAIGGTRRHIRDMREAQFDADLQRIMLSLEWRFEQNLLTRMFSTAETLIATAGYDVSFCHNGSNVAYAPPSYGGQSFATTHEHYNGHDSATVGWSAMLNSMAEHLQEHGHEPPYTTIVARANVTSYQALADFVEPLGNTPIVIVDKGGISSGEATYFSQEQREFGRIGGFNTEYGYTDIRATARVPSGYAAIFKSYGQLDPRNSLAVRVHPAEGFGAFVVAETAIDDDYPLKQLDVEFEFGAGVGKDRTNASMGYRVSGGTWANPTIS